MSKDNKNVSQKTVTKKSKEEKELEQKIEKLEQERKKHQRELEQERKKHQREWMEEGLKFLGDKKSTKDLDPINFQKILENYKTELSDRWFHVRHYPPACEFSGYYFLLETFYCCSSDDIAGYLGIKPKLVDQLKKSLWEWCNNSEKNLLKLHNKKDFGYFNQKVAQFQFYVHKNSVDFSEESYLRIEKLEKSKFDNLEIDLKEELIGYWPIAIESQISWWRRFSLIKLTEYYEISLEEAVKYKIHYLAHGIDSAMPSEDFAIKEAGEYPYPDYEKIYKSIRKEIIKDFNPKKDYLDKLNKIAVEICSYQDSKNEFIDEKPSLLRKKYNLNGNDYSEIKNNIISKIYDEKIQKQGKLNLEFKSVEDDKKSLRSQAIGNVYAVNTKLEAENTELEKEIEHRKSLEKRMKKLVAQYSHTLGNTLLPETIHKVAYELMKHYDLGDKSLILLRAYHAELLVRNQAELLRIEHGSEDGSEFRRYILGDRLEEDIKEGAITVKEIIDYATERVVGRLLNQNESKLKVARDHLLQKSGMGLDDLRNDFEGKVFFTDKKQTALKWIDSKLGKTRIGELSSSWKKVRLRRDGYAHALLQGHWGELFFNAFKYADHTKDNFLTIDFEEFKEDDHTWLKMIWGNPCTKTGKKDVGEGLVGIAEHLQQLNEKESKKLTLNYDYKNNRFLASLNYRSDMLLPYKSKIKDLEEKYWGRKGGNS